MARLRDWLSALERSGAVFSDSSSSVLPASESWVQADSEPISAWTGAAGELEGSSDGLGASEDGVWGSEGPLLLGGGVLPAERVRERERERERVLEQAKGLWQVSVKVRAAAAASMSRFESRMGKGQSGGEAFLRGAPRGLGVSCAYGGALGALASDRDFDASGDWGGSLEVSLSLGPWCGLSLAKPWLMHDRHWGTFSFGIFV